MHQITIVSSGPQGQNEYQYDNQPDEISLIAMLRMLSMQLFLHTQKDARRLFMKT